MIGPVVRDQAAPALPAGTRQAPPPPVSERRASLPERVARRLVQDLLGIRPVLLLAQGLVSLIPRATFGWLRPALYRAAGVHIGARTRIYGKMAIEGVGRVDATATPAERRGVGLDRDAVERYRSLAARRRDR